MISTRTELITYPAPPEAVAIHDFSVRVRAENGEWQDLFPYLVPVDIDLEDPRTIYVKPGNHRTEELAALLTSSIGNVSDCEGLLPEVLYFGPGMHVIEEKILRIPSGKTVYLAGGAMVVGSMVCDHVEDVTIRGRGIIYLTNIEKTTYLRTVQIDFSRNITVEGIISVDPPHYSIHLGK
ncbi:hypothetical protein L1N85_24335 [Paenibacillus alkaliterrae]|uniref:hypothetical protein n=1 Tax=Paenibacillus alkaliterrae TaxID=320909 RepID=UPI001F45C98C|nr:hypothetical protein [Paenibacillus alkaliterrae]MCF2941473.1 hypothetical protein [Paenibacillus alkaliterrae]